MRTSNFFVRVAFILYDLCLYYNKVSDIEKIDHNLIIEFVNDYCFDAESFSEIFEEIYQVIKST